MSGPLCMPTAQSPRWNRLNQHAAVGKVASSVGHRPCQSRVNGFCKLIQFLFACSPVCKSLGDLDGIATAPRPQEVPAPTAPGGDEEPHLPVGDLDVPEAHQSPYWIVAQPVRLGHRAYSFPSSRST